MSKVFLRYIRKVWDCQWQQSWIWRGELPALCRRLAAVTLIEWEENLARSSGSVMPSTLMAHSLKVLVKDGPDKYFTCPFLSIQNPTGWWALVWSWRNAHCWMHSAACTGHHKGQASSDVSLMDWPFWHFFWKCQVNSATLAEFLIALDFISLRFVHN